MNCRADRRSGGGWSLVGFLALGLLLLSTTGCRRGFYRRQADREVYGLVDCAADATGMTPGQFTIEPDPQSRMFDPNCPDRPPMPPDDPTSHQLMHCVDCKPGWPCWHCWGETPHVENPEWMLYLPHDENGQVVIDRPEAMRLALQNSREYQQELENLYLSALNVTFQRFQLDAQFFGGNSTFFTADGPARNKSRGSLLTVDNDNNIQKLRMQKLLAGGGELVVGMANSLVWQFAGPDTYAANTLLDFSLVQPLLRGAGRAVVLERLTDSERALLANIRQMERFQRGFYAQIVAGRDAGSGPVPGSESSPSGPGIDTGSIRGSGGSGAGGYLGLLEDWVLIRNQKSNVVGLRESLERLEELHAAGRITATQVGLTRQSLYDAQSNLIRITAGYQTALDAYKITLGLPPQIDIRIEDDLLARFDLINPALLELQDEMTLLLGRFSELTDATADQVVRPLKDPAETAAFYQSTDNSREVPDGDADGTNAFHAIGQAAMAQLEAVALDLQTLEEATDQRRENLTRLSAREEFDRGDIDPRIGDADAFIGRVAKLHTGFASLRERMQTTWSKIEPTRQTAVAKVSAAGVSPAAAVEAAEAHQQFKDLMSRLATQLDELSVIQARGRLDTVTLGPSQLTAEVALETARENRRDWRNARAALVDQWRLIEVVANDLESALDITFSGDINTTDNNPVRFRGTTGSLRVGLAFDAPLTRLAERNAYRRALIAYQQTRRQFYAFEDLIASQLRNTIRTIRLNELNFEVQRAAVFVAITRVDEAQEKLREPKREVGSMKLDGNTARDLVDALTGLLSAQNGFLSVWVDQEVQRLNLDFDLGTMQLDQNGMWIDPTP